MKSAGIISTSALSWGWVLSATFTLFTYPTGLRKLSIEPASPSRAPSPLPNPLCGLLDISLSVFCYTYGHSVAFEHLLGEVEIVGGAVADDIIENYRLAVGRGFAEPYISLYHSLEYHILEMLLQILDHLVMNLGAAVEHCDQEAF